MLRADISKKLKNFDLDLRFEAEGGCLGILGPSGCGKSMTLKAVAGLVRPDRGQIRRDDRVLFDSGRGIDLPPQKRKVGYLFQHYALFPNMTVAQNIEAGLLRSRQDRSARRERVEKLIRRFRLEGLENQYPWPGSSRRTQNAFSWTSRFPPWTATYGRRCRWSLPG